MGTVVAQASMSLDGYVAKNDNSIGRLFDWYEAGDVELASATSGLTFHRTPESAAYRRAAARSSPAWRPRTSRSATRRCASRARG